MEIEFHEKARLLKSALNRLHAARLAHKTANKVYNDSKCWRRDASVEAELRRIKLARVLN